MKLIAQSFKGNYREIVLGPLFKLLEAVLELFVPLVMAGIIDVGVKNGDVFYILQRGVLLLVLAVAGAAAGITCQYFAAVAGRHFGVRLRSRLFSHVMRLSADEVSALGEGRLITRMTNDANQIQTGLNMAIRLGTRAPFLAIGSIVMAMVLNWRIGLVFLLSTPLIVLVLFFIMRRTVPSYGRIQAGQDALAGLAGENLAGVRVIRAFSRQKRQQREFDEQSDELTGLIVRVGKISAVLNPLTGFIVNVAIILIVWLGANFAYRGTAAPGEIIALVSYMSQTLLALIVAANLIVLFTRALASGRRVVAVLETQPSVRDEKRQLKGQLIVDSNELSKGQLLVDSNELLVEGQGKDEGQEQKQNPAAGIVPAIEFRDVRFAYHAGGEDALDAISFAVAPGETLGIIGGTGSGKSTIVRLLLRYYDVSGGQVLVDGEDVRRMPQAALRAKMGLVPQRAALFSGSVRDNLLFAKPGATDAEIWQALEVAQAAPFVRQLPEGLDTGIREGGKNLSGGQKQRLTIARALVRRPEILILDDAASALDYATDAAFRKALEKQTIDNRHETIAEGKKGQGQEKQGQGQNKEQGQGDGQNSAPAARPMTTVIISQRAASIRAADAILVLDDGRLVGSGTHAELLETNEVYREICASQGLLEGQKGQVSKGPPEGQPEGLLPGDSGEVPAEGEKGQRQNEGAEAEGGGQRAGTDRAGDSRPGGAAAPAVHAAYEKNELAEGAKGPAGGE